MPKVINEASDLFIELWGGRGEHARAAVGVASLSNDAPVEIGGDRAGARGVTISYKFCRDSRFCPNRHAPNTFPKWLPCSKEFFVKRNYAGGQQLVPLA
jgi:hypothetical protein